jgi:dienelactone hydrolase
MRRGGFAVLLLAAACAAPAPETSIAPRATATLAIPIEVLKPAGSGPFPAVVILHDCSGLGPRSSGAPRRWARELLARGYVVAIPDSFGSRGFPNGVCTDPSPSRNDVSPFRRVADAYDALDHLRTLPYVDGKRVGVMGGSHGGSSTLATIAVNARDSERLAQRKREGFAAAIALYPGCAIGNPPFTRQFTAGAPLMILGGELDDWTPAAPCRALVAAARDGSPASIKVYPGAHHSFDSAAPVRYNAERINPNAPGGRGATIGGDADAWADAIHEVGAFFAQHLGGSP